jgi:hypothetical protein
MLKNLKVDNLKKVTITPLKKLLKDLKDEYKFEYIRKGATSLKSAEAHKLIDVYLYHYLKSKGSKMRSTPSPKKASPKKASPKKASPKKASPKKASKESNLPDGWLEKLDKTSGRTFYYNKVTKKSQWNKPETEYDQLKKLYKNLKNDVSLDYLKALHLGKKCDIDEPCDDGDCDLENNKCVPESKEDNYLNMDRMLHNGKYFLGTKNTINELRKKLKPKTPSPKTPSPPKKSKTPSPPKKSKTPSPPKKSKTPSPVKKPKSPSPVKKPKSPSPEEDSDEEIDLNGFDQKDFDKLSELQKALVNCLMPSNKYGAKSSFKH